jgi:biopolymer transport protein ExbD
MRKTFRTRVEDSTFELNLAPMLDIIVSIVPMLLLSVVFVHITTVDTPIPQAVEKAMVKAEKNNETQITLDVSKDTGFKFTIVSNGNTKLMNVGLSGKDLDLIALHKQVLSLKQQYPDVFRLELHPEEAVVLKEIVAVMDQLRTRVKDDPKVFFKDADSGKLVETDLIFPDVVFGNVAGG